MSVAAPLDPDGWMGEAFASSGARMDALVRDLRASFERPDYWREDGQPAPAAHLPGTASPSRRISA